GAVNASGDAGTGFFGAPGNSCLPTSLAPCFAPGTSVGGFGVRILGSGALCGLGNRCLPTSPGVDEGGDGDAGLVGGPCACTPVLIASSMPAQAPRAYSAVQEPLSIQRRRLGAQVG